MLCFNFNIMSLLLSLLTCCLRLCLVVMSLHVEEFFSFFGGGGVVSIYCTQVPPVLNPLSVDDCRL